MKQAIIRGFLAQPGSGIAFLVLEANGKRFRVPCDNGPLVRLLDDIWNGFIVPPRHCNHDRIKGQHILYDVDEYGLLAALQPLDS